MPFEQGVFPSELKLTIITPLYKAKDPVFYKTTPYLYIISVFENYWAPGVQPYTELY